MRILHPAVLLTHQYIRYAFLFYTCTLASIILTRWYLHIVTQAPLSEASAIGFIMSLLHRKHKDHHANADPGEPPIASLEQIGQHKSTSKVPRRRSSGLKFFASSATPKAETSRDPHKAWEAGYLMDLRVNRPQRPGGSRPLPGRAATYTPEPYARASSAMSSRPDNSLRKPDHTSVPLQERSASALSHRRATSHVPRNHEDIGRPLVRDPSGAVISRDFSNTIASSQTPAIVPSGVYRESGMRWMEKQEARSLREALEDMDMRDEAKIHADAQDEASELVQKHRTSGLPSGNQYQPYRYMQHLEKGAHARSQSIGWSAVKDVTGKDESHAHSSTTNGSASSNSDNDASPPNTAFTNASQANNVGDGSGHVLWDSPEKKAYMNLTSIKLPSINSGRRRSSGPRARDVSGGLFRNPDDKIYEEPDDTQKSSTSMRSEQSRIPCPLSPSTRNIMPEFLSNNTSQRPRIVSAEDKGRVYRSEIHRNPPSQSRNPSYLQNEHSPEPLCDTRSSAPGADLNIQQSKDGREIRSEDIKAATSMRLKDRSPKLPSPTVVSDRPGRPIVSFSQDWKPKDSDRSDGDTTPTRPSGLPPRMRFKPKMPSSTASAPVIPTINVPELPSIRVNDSPPKQESSIPSMPFSGSSIPTISLSEDEPGKRPLPTPSSKSRPSPANRPLPHHSMTTPVHSNKLHWSPSSRRATAQCAACALPIEGRIVSAASQRFHPHCFTCYHCAEALECVAFYPEPDTARDARLARIEARANGASPPEEEEKHGETALDDGDASLRFYCHLDFHEIFSPRCRSCKTPIETEVIIACGASWHVGHFFCAQCGDPFDAKTPFVEKDGYAWCVGCHAGRFSGKCKGCKKPVVDGGVMALEGEWHVECFCCVVSTL